MSVGVNEAGKFDLDFHRSKLAALAQQKSTTPSVPALGVQASQDSALNGRDNLGVTESDMEEVRAIALLEFMDLESQSPQSFYRNSRSTIRKAKEIFVEGAKSNVLLNSNKRQEHNAYGVLFTPKRTRNVLLNSNGVYPYATPHTHQPQPPVPDRILAEYKEYWKPNGLVEYMNTSVGAIDPLEAITLESGIDLMLQKVESTATQPFSFNKEQYMKGHIFLVRAKTYYVPGLKLNLHTLIDDVNLKLRKEDSRAALIQILNQWFDTLEENMRREFSARAVFAASALDFYNVGVPQRVIEAIQERDANEPDEAMQPLLYRTPSDAQNASMYFPDGTFEIANISLPFDEQHWNDPRNVLGKYIYYKVGVSNLDELTSAGNEGITPAQNILDLVKMASSPLYHDRFRQQAGLKTPKIKPVLTIAPSLARILEKQKSFSSTADNGNDTEFGSNVLINLLPELARFVTLNVDSSLEPRNGEEFSSDDLVGHLFFPDAHRTLFVEPKDITDLMPDYPFMRKLRGTFGAGQTYLSFDVPQNSGTIAPQGDVTIWGKMNMKSGSILKTHIAIHL